MGGESGTSHTGDIHYYYICLSRRKKRAKCTTKAVLKQWLEDIVINATVKMLESTAAIHNVAQEIFNLHTKQVADNSALKLIEQKRKEAVKAQNNMIKAIEQGIITEATKSRLTELETLISQYDFDIAKEKARNYTFLTVEQIEMFLSRFVFENPSDMKVRKLIVNTFIREVILYPDRVVITYNFTDNPEHIKFTKEHVVKTEKEIETADKTVFSSLKGSYIYGSAAPISSKQTQGFSIGFVFLSGETAYIQSRSFSKFRLRFFRAMYEKYVCRKITAKKSRRHICIFNKKSLLKIWRGFAWRGWRDFPAPEVPGYGALAGRERQRHCAEG